MKKIILSVTSISFLLLLNSCVSNKKIEKINHTIEGQKQLEKSFDSTLTSLSDLRDEKNAKGELDDTSSNAIKKLLDKESFASKKRTDSLIAVQAKISAKRPKVREYKNMILVMTTEPYVVNQKMGTVEFINQLLKQQTFIKFNTAAFFPPGGYKIPTEKIEDAKLVFTPLVDSLLAFMQRFPNMTLVSSIVASGYADGTGFSPGALVNMLSDNLRKTGATKEELNIELSRIRAEDVAGILAEIFKEKVQQLPASSSYNTRFFITGKGEEFPNKKITSYTVDDERRRIVVIYWNALPAGEM